jgi:hypothetical protein
MGVAALGGGNPPSAPSSVTLTWVPASKASATFAASGGDSWLGVLGWPRSDSHPGREPWRVLSQGRDESAGKRAGEEHHRAFRNSEPGHFCGLERELARAGNSRRGVARDKTREICQRVSRKCAYRGMEMDCRRVTR